MLRRLGLKVVAYIREHSERFKSFLAKDTQAGHEHQELLFFDKVICQ